MDAASDGVVSKKLEWPSGQLTGKTACLRRRKKTWMPKFNAVPRFWETSPVDRRSPWLSPARRHGRSASALAAARDSSEPSWNSPGCSPALIGVSLSGYKFSSHFVPSESDLNIKGHVLQAVRRA